MPHPQSRQPAILAIFAAIIAERFAWYLMLGELAMWQGTVAVGNMIAVAYAATLLGGLLANRLSLRTVCALGATLLCAGYSAAVLGNYTGMLTLCALGCGLFKPCLATLLGNFYEIGTDRTRAYSRFYAAINLGSLPSTLVGAWLRSHYGISIAMCASAVAALLALIALTIGWRHLTVYKTEEQAVAAALGDATVAKVAETGGWGRVAVLCIGAVLFFTAFQQQSTTLVAWARDRLHIADAETVSSLNPLCVLLLAATPIAGWSSSLRVRLVLSMLTIGAAFALLVVWPDEGIAALAGWYVLATVGEVLISPLGMDLVTSYVPRRQAALAMAVWLLSMSAGGKLAGVLSGWNLDVAVRVSLGLCLGGAVWFGLLVRRVVEPVATVRESARVTT